MSSDSDFLADLEACDSCLQSGDVPSATKAFEHLTVKWSDRVESWSFLGFFYIQQGRFDDAVLALKQGLQINPEHHGTRMNLVVAYRRSGNIASAATLLQSLISQTDGQTREQMTTLLSDTLSQSKDEDLIRTALSRLLQSYPADPAIMSLALHLYESLNDYDACVPLLKQQVAMNPVDTFKREKLAYTLFACGKSDEARQEFDQLKTAFNTSDAGQLRFHENYSAGLVATGTRPSPKRRQRFNSLVNLFEGTINLDGHMAECGTYRGLSAFVLCQTIKHRHGTYTGEKFHCFDSFEGLSTPVAEDQDETTVKNSLKPGAFKCELDVVRANLHDFPGISFYKGWIPDRFPDVQDLEFSFVSIDVDLYQPSKDALQFFYPRLAKAGLIVCDDYNWAGQKKAVEEFCASNRLEFLVTDSDQAVIHRQ